MATLETTSSPNSSPEGSPVVSDASAGPVTPQDASPVQDTLVDESESDNPLLIGEEDTDDVTLDQPADQQTPPQKQSKDVDAAFANLRREKEALAKELQQRDAWVQQNFGSYGITTWDQYQAAVAAQQKQQAEEQARAEEEKLKQQAKEYEERVREYGLEPDDLVSLVANSPVVRELKQKAELYEKERQQLAQQRHLENLTGQARVLLEKYPNVTEIDEATKRIFNGGANGLTLVQAYEAAHHDELVAAARANGQQGAAARIASKDHLGTERGGSTELAKPVRISREEMATWRAFGYKDPKDIAKRKRKYLKK